MTKTEDEQQAASDLLFRDTAHFGGCPHCDTERRQYNNEYVNVGRVHFFICRLHRVFWGPVGSNLFSSWREQDEATWKENERLLATFAKVESSDWEWVPWHEAAVPADRCSPRSRPDEDIPF